MFWRSTDPARQAANYFRAGRFDDAERLAHAALARDSRRYDALLRLGQLALLSNRLEEARAWLEQALARRPRAAEAQALLAEAAYRQDDFAAAARWLKALGRHASARKLEHCAAGRPNQLDGPDTPVSLPFVQAEPLPVVAVRLNGGPPLHFFIDTGAAEVFVDAALAREIGLPLFGAEQGRFAGGQAAMQHGCLAALELNGLVMRDVPIQTMDVRRFSDPVFGGRRVDGILGTVLLYHFLATIDYPGQALVLRRKTPANQQAFERAASAAGSTRARFWLAGDHIAVTWGRLNGAEPRLFFLDTGVAGASFTCPKATLTAAGLNPRKDQAGQGQGGGGRVTTLPFELEALTVGDVTQRPAQGIYMGAYPLENAFGFQIAGSVGHDFFRRGALTLDYTAMHWYSEGH